MTTLISNFKSGTLDAGVTDVATTITSAAFANLPVVASPDVLKIVLDPEGGVGDPEIMIVTTHTASSTSITVTRGGESSTARAHGISIVWIQPGTAGDWTEALNSPPIGSMMAYAGTASPDTNKWLLCDGDAVSRTTYAALFALTSTTFGTGDGSTTFNVPDMRGRVPMGLDNLGGASANTIVAAAADTLGGTLGVETHQLTLAEVAGHTHTGPAHTHAGPSHTHAGPSHSHSFSDVSTTQSANHTHAVSGTTGSDSHNHSPVTGSSGFLTAGSGSTVLGDGGTLQIGTAGTSTLTTSDAHTHSWSDTSTTNSVSHTHTVSGTTGLSGTAATSASGTGATTSSGTAATGSAGSDTAHTNTQPSLSLGYLIRAA